MHAQPIFNCVPNGCREAALEEEVRRRLLDFIAKLTKITILPPSTLQSIRRLYPILKNQPSEELAFGGSPLGHCRQTCLGIREIVIGRK